MWQVTKLAKRFMGVIVALGIVLAPVTSLWAADGSFEAAETIFLPSIVHNATQLQQNPAARQPVELIIGFEEVVYSASAGAVSSVDAMAAVDNVLAVNGATVTARLPELQAQVVALPAEQADSVAGLLAGQPGVAYVEPNHLAEGQFTPNDSYYLSHQYAPKLIDAEGAWAITRGDASVLVAVIDSGATFTHPDMQGKLVAGWDYVNNHANPVDDHGHGTHVAGIIAAGFHNNLGVAGIGGDARVLVYKVLNDKNTGSYSNIAAAIVAATDAGAQVINLSLGGGASSVTLQKAVNYAWQHNVLIVAAAGNNGNNTPFYPAAYPQVIGVTMTNQNDGVVSLSNYGDWVSIAAPGWAVRSTDWAGSLGEYGTRSGTSMAAPHVAGVAALLFAVAPLSNQEVRTLLESTADDLGTPGFDAYYGHGRVNAQNAVKAARLNVQPEPTATPVVTPVATATSSPVPTKEPTPSPTPVLTSTPMPTPILEPALPVEPTPTQAPPTQTPAPEPTATVEPTVTPEPVVTAAPTIEPTPTAVVPPVAESPAPATTLRSGSLTGEATLWGQDWRAKVIVKMVDSNGAPVANATVQGEWRDGFSGMASCVTNDNGICSINSGQIWRNFNNVDFELIIAQHATLSYSASGNTKVQIRKP